MGNPEIQIITLPLALFEIKHNFTCPYFPQIFIFISYFYSWRILSCDFIIFLSLNLSTVNFIYKFTFLVMRSQTALVQILALPLIKTMYPGVNYLTCSKTQFPKLQSGN